MPRRMAAASAAAWPGSGESGRVQPGYRRVGSELPTPPGQIERDLAQRMAESVGSKDPASISSEPADPVSADTRRAGSADPPVCSACSTTNDPDARFCKSCGQKL